MYKSAIEKQKKKSSQSAKRPVHPIHDTPRALILGGAKHPPVVREDER